MSADMNTMEEVTRYKEELIFQFDAGSIDFERRELDNFIFASRINLENITATEFIEISHNRNLKVGLKVYESHSKSKIIFESRGSATASSYEPRSIKVVFAVPRSFFKGCHCRVAALDLLYEMKFWFSETLHEGRIFPLAPPPERTEVDIFKYYFDNFGQTANK